MCKLSMKPLADGPPDPKCVASFESVFVKWVDVNWLCPGVTVSGYCNVRQTAGRRKQVRVKWEQKTD